MSLAQVKKNDDKERELGNHSFLISDPAIRQEAELNMNVRKEL